MRRRVVYDGLMVGGAIAFACFETLHPQGTMRPWGGLTTVAMSALAVSLAWRRRWPVAVGLVAVTAAGTMLLVEWMAPGTLLVADPDPEAGPWLPPIAPFAAYSVMAFARDRRAAWLVVGALTAAAAGLTSMAGLPSSIKWYGQYVVTGVFIAVPALLGVHAAVRRRLVETLVERAERAEWEHHLLAEQARAEERERLAAEMHDVVTHRVSLMVLRAGALRMTAGDEATRVAAEDLRATGSLALAELRDFVRVLRGAATAPRTHVTRDPVPDLSPLTAESRAVGLDVELAEQGTPTPVSPVVGRAAYRIVQEALTNVRKHAPGARARVEVHHRPDGVRLRVWNTAPTRTGDPALAAGSGTGLAGLRQRVDLVGGILHAGPDQDGGFLVEAALPVDVPMPPEPAA